MNNLQITVNSPDEQKLIDGAIAMLSAQGLLTKFDENQQKAFIMTCMAIGVNPLLKEAYAVPYDVYDPDTKKKVKTLGIIIDYKVYLARAERSGLLDGWETKFEGNVVKKKITKSYQNGNSYQKTVIDTDKTDLKGTITIYRKDWKKPFKSRPLSVVDEMKDTDFWHDDPVGMLEKALIREFFQKVFPKDCDLRDDTKEYRITNETPDYEVVETKPPVDQKDRAIAYKNALDALNAVALTSTVRDQYNAKIKEALTNSDLDGLAQVTGDLELLRADQQQKAIDSREPAPSSDPEPDPVQVEIMPDPEPEIDTAEQKGKNAVLTVLRGLLTRGWHPVQVRNSLKKHLSLDVAEDEDWEALLWKAPFDRTAWVKAYKHWDAESKKYDIPRETKAIESCRVAIAAILEKVEPEQHKEWNDQFAQCQTDDEYNDLAQLARTGLDLINNEKF